MSVPIADTVPGDSLVFCLFCVENSALIRISKARMPYLDCPECKTRVFWNTAKAVRGYFRWCPDAINAVRGLQGLEPVDERSRYEELKTIYGEFAIRSLVAKRTRRTAKHEDPDDDS